MRPGPVPTLIAAGGALLFAWLAAAASAQTTNGHYLGPPRTYDIQTMSFSLWCQETQRYPAARCEQRLAGDVAAFEEFRRVIERYEVQFLQQRQRELSARNRGNIDPAQTIRRLQDAPLH